MERAQGISANEESTDVNPAWQALVSERMKARLALSGLESKAEQLRRELAERQKAALDFTEAGPEYDAAVRRVTAARANHELYAKREEEARIAEVLDRQRISNVVLAQAPVVSYVPAKPNKRLGVVAGAIAAGVIALGLAFLREIFGRRGPAPARGRNATDRARRLGRPRRAAMRSVCMRTLLAVLAVSTLFGAPPAAAQTPAQAPAAPR